MADVGDYNLRSLIFACQKTADIFSNYTEELDVEFLKCVFLGNVAFSLRVKENDDLKWEKDMSPNQLGTSKYPLYEFCKEYIKYQELNYDDIKSAQEAFLEQKEYEKKQRETNTALSVLYDFPTQKSIILGVAVEKVLEELKNGSTIPLIQYGKLANYLIAVRMLLENPEIIDECKKVMLANIKNDIKKDTKVLDRLRFHDSFNLWNSQQQEEYNEFIQDLSKAFQDNTLVHLTTDDPITYLENLSKFMCDKESDIRQSKKLLNNIDLDKLLIGLEKATAEQVSDFREGILSIYRIANIRDFLPDDKEALDKLKTGVQQLLNDDKGADKVVRLQYAWLINNLDKVIENYS